MRLTEKCYIFVKSVIIMSPTKKIKVEEVEITIFEKPNEADYISLTDMAHYKNTQRTNYIIQNWMRLRSTIEFLGLWETVNNPFFKGIEFDAFKKDAGANAFSLTPKEWIEKTAAIGIISRPGRNGGTFAHKDIAFEFGTWLSPAFKLYLIREYQKLKDAERNPLLAEWNVKRILSKVNYDLHTEAVRDYIVPTLMDESQIKFAYTSEADLLNLALFHYTAKRWREANPGLAEKGLNPRDMASISELVVLGNLENVNALLIKQDLDRKRRYEILSEIAASQLKSLKQSNPDNRFRALPNASPELPE